MGLINRPERTGLGWDFAGTVDATGPGADLVVGTRVAGLVNGFDRDFGTYAARVSHGSSRAAVAPTSLAPITTPKLRPRDSRRMY